MEGASEAGAEVELINLYDRSLNYKGCMSCFACKIKGGKKDFMHPIVLKPKVSATIYTMNCPHMQMYRRNGYDITMDVNAHSLGMLGPTGWPYSERP